MRSGAQERQSCLVEEEQGQKRQVVVEGLPRILLDLEGAGDLR
jgi:hypothetical protein